MNYGVLKFLNGLFVGGGRALGKARVGLKFFSNYDTFLTGGGLRGKKTCEW